MSHETSARLRAAIAMVAVLMGTHARGTGASTGSPDATERPAVSPADLDWRRIADLEDRLVQLDRRGGDTGERDAIVAQIVADGAVMAEALEPLAVAARRAAQHAEALSNRDGAERSDYLDRVLQLGFTPRELGLEPRQPLTRERVAEIVEAVSRREAAPCAVARGLSEIAMDQQVAMRLLSAVQEREPEELGCGLRALQGTSSPWLLAGLWSVHAGRPDAEGRHAVLETLASLDPTGETVARVLDELGLEPSGLGVTTRVLLRLDGSRLRDPRARSLILAHARLDGDERLRRAALMFLAHDPTEDEVAAVRDVILDTTAPTEVRLAARTALRSAGVLSLGGPLDVQLLTGAASPEMRERLVREYASIGPYPGDGAIRRALAAAVEAEAPAR